jgi:hypothetical protein
MKQSDYDRQLDSVTPMRLSDYRQKSSRLQERRAVMCNLLAQTAPNSERKSIGIAINGIDHEIGLLEDAWNICSSADELQESISGKKLKTSVKGAIVRPYRSTNSQFDRFE